MSVLRTRHKKGRIMVSYNVIQLEVLLTWKSTKFLTATQATAYRSWMVMKNVWLVIYMIFCHQSKTLSVVSGKAHISASLPHAFFYIYCFGSACCKLQDINWDIDSTSFPQAAFRIIKWCPIDSTKGENYALVLLSLFFPRVAQDFLRQIYILAVYSGGISSWIPVNSTNNVFTDRPNGSKVNRGEWLWSPVNIKRANKYTKIYVGSRPRPCTIFCFAFIPNVSIG